jgi:hypothetical protein
VVEAQLHGSLPASHSLLPSELSTRLGWTFAGTLACVGVAACKGEAAIASDCTTPLP